MKNRVFSGARPTGRQHIGNYLGAIQNYVKLQEEYECIYCIVDLHALTTLEDFHNMQYNIREMMYDWLAAGLDPNKSILFVQSHVPEVTELHLLLSMITPLTWLTRVPTFKEKVRQQPHNVNYGLVGYPVLQTADIILYKADLVPVGEDQLPHLELAREIVRRFNHLVAPVFPEPQAKLTSTPLIGGLDGENKMSKSLDNHIELASSAEETRQRIMTAFTDPQRLRRKDPGRPEICNIYSLHGFYNPDKLGEIADGCRTAAIGCVDCKKMLADALNADMEPFRERRAEFAAKPEQVEKMLTEGASRARVIARETILEVKEKMCLL